MLCHICTCMSNMPSILHDNALSIINHNTILYIYTITYCIPYNAIIDSTILFCTELYPNVPYYNLLYHDMPFYV